MTALLGGEKGMEELADLIWRHTASRVRNQDLDGIVGRVLAGGKGDGASLVHGMNGIDDDVHEHLLKLGFVRHDRRKHWGRSWLSTVMFRNCAWFVTRDSVSLEDVVEVGKFGIDLGMARELQQALDDITAALSSA